MDFKNFFKNYEEGEKDDEGSLIFTFKKNSCFHPMPRLIVIGGCVYEKDRSILFKSGIEEPVICQRYKLISRYEDTVFFEEEDDMDIINSYM